MIDAKFKRQLAEITGKEMMASDPCGIVAEGLAVKLVDSGILAKRPQGDAWMHDDGNRFVPSCRE